jgi:hypothetical protein
MLLVFKLFHTLEKRDLSILFVLVGLDAPEEIPDDEVSDRLINDFSIKSNAELYGE